MIPPDLFSTIHHFQASPFSHIPISTPPHLHTSHRFPTAQQAEEDAEEERRRRDQELEAAAAAAAAATAAAATAVEVPAAVEEEDDVSVGTAHTPLTLPLSSLG